MAQTAVKVAYTGGGDSSAAIFAALENGFFKSRGLDVQTELIGIGANIPPALMANSVQIGAATTPLLLAAVEGGIDLVAIANATVTSKSIPNISAVARPDAGIKTAKDFVGKKVAVPGINGFLHVLFKAWLIQNGVDPNAVTYIEVAFPKIGDLIKAGTVEGGVVSDPLLSRIVDSGVGVPVGKMAADLPEDTIIVVYVSTREWAEKNRETVEKFRAALAEGSAFATANPDKTRDYLGKYMKLPPAVTKTLRISKLSTDVARDQIAWWIDTMKKQNLLRAELDPAKIIFK
jgi:NitT/TauT family transport system substrate-binding protein